MYVDKETEWLVILYMAYAHVQNFELDVDIDGVVFYIHKGGFRSDDGLMFRCFSGNGDYRLREGLMFDCAYKGKVDYLYRRCMNFGYPHTVLLLYYFWGAFFRDFVYNGYSWHPSLKECAGRIYSIINELV